MAIQIRWRESDIPYLESEPTIPATASYNTNTAAYPGYDDYTTYEEPTSISNIPSVHTATATITTTSTASPTINAVATKLVQAQSMSRGAKIGLGVAIPIGFLGIAAAALAGCFLFWRRRRSRSSGSSLPRVQSTRSARYATMEQSLQMTQSPGDVDEYPSPSSQTQGQGPLRSPTDFDPRLLTASPSPSPPPANESIGIARTIGIASPAYSGHVRVSSLPEVVTSPNDDEEVRQIQIERARLQERRSRLFQINQLDQQEERLRQRLESRVTAIGGQPSHS